MNMPIPTSHFRPMRGPKGDQGPQGPLGPEGPDGPQGPQGLPGVNAVPADEAVAGYISTAGTSQTKTALDEAVGTFVTPQRFGAKADGVTDDTAAVQAALDDPRPVFFPAGTYLVGNLVDTRGEAIQGGGMNASRIKAKPGTTGVLYTCLQMAGKIISDLWFDGAGEVATAINTDWVIPEGGAAPSQGNCYSNLRVSGYTSVGWTAQSNNDSPFDNVLIETGAPGSTLALRLNASGGMVELNECRFNLPFELVCQTAVISGGYFLGLRVTDADWNMLSVSGGYWYAEGTNRKCITIEAGAQIMAATFNAIHMENAYADGALIGGPGAIYATMKFDGGHLFSTAGGNTTRLLGADLGSPAGPKPRVYLDHAFVEGLDLDSVPATTTLSTINCVVNGTFRESRFGFTLGGGATELLLDSRGMSSHNDGIGTTPIIRRGIASIANGATHVFTGLPRAGLLHIKSTSWDGASVLVYYSRIGAEAGTVVPIAAQQGAGGVDLAVSIPAGNAQDAYTTSVSVSHDGATPGIYSCSAFGF